MAAGERKRPYLGDDAEDSSPSSKKTRTAPEYKPYLPPPSSSVTAAALPSSASSATIDLAAKRAEIQAKLAAMKKLAPPPASLPPPPPQAAPAASKPLPPVPGLPKPDLDTDAGRKAIAEARKRVAALAAGSGFGTGRGPPPAGYGLPPPKPNPYLAHAPHLQQQQGTSLSASSPYLDPAIAARGGLNTAIHPLLMDTGSAPAEQSKKDRYRPMAPKFASVKANESTSSGRSSPALGGSARASPAPGLPVKQEDEELAAEFIDRSLVKSMPKSHMGGRARPGFHFNAPGKHIARAEAERKEREMEAARARVAEMSRKSGLDQEIEEQALKLKRPAPPEFEWWDEPFLRPLAEGEEPKVDGYEDRIDVAFLIEKDAGGAIDHLVQHPLQIPPPSTGRENVAPRALDLTKKEMKKKRRLRRMEELKDKQDRQKMGLLAPDKPKVAIKNMMRVLTQEAIADPTKIEAQIRREVNARNRTHLKANEARKLTPDERREKLEEKKIKDAERGISSLCFSIKYFSHQKGTPQWFKVSKNAEQLGLTGLAIFGPDCNLVLVEGGRTGLKKFRHLMLNRIDWTEEAQARAVGVLDDEDEYTDIPRPLAATSSAPATASTVKTEDGDPPSLADNKCTLVWNGESKERGYPNFWWHDCQSDRRAREILGQKNAALWDLAKKADAIGVDSMLD